MGNISCIGFLQEVILCAKRTANHTPITTPPNLHPDPNPNMNLNPNTNQTFTFASNFYVKKKVPMHSKEIPDVILQVNGKWRAV